MKIVTIFIKLVKTIYSNKVKFDLNSYETNMEKKGNTFHS